MFICAYIFVTGKERNKMSASSTAICINVLNSNSVSCPQESKNIVTYETNDNAFDHIKAPYNETNNEKVYCCYVLQSITNPRRTYVGMSNDCAQRLRRHNGLITGGARATRANRPWRKAAIVKGFGLNKKAALQFEWSWRHPRQRRLKKPWWSLEGRLNCARQLLNTLKWTESEFNLELDIFF